MKAAIALLADFRIQNIARRMVFEMSQRAPIEFFGSLLPAHVSLKQPFTFEDMDRLESWFDTLAARTEPFEIVLDAPYYASWDDYGFVGFRVVETIILRNLHNQINNELSTFLKDPSAPHDGDGYRFHLTIELGRIRGDDPYKTYFNGLPAKNVRLAFRAEQLAMFHYMERPIAPGSFFLYRVMPLGI